MLVIHTKHYSINFPLIPEREVDRVVIAWSLRDGTTEQKRYLEVRDEKGRLIRMEEIIGVST